MGYPIGAPHWRIYWCTRTNDRKRIKEQDSMLKKKQTIANQSTKKTANFDK